MHVALSTEPPKRRAEEYEYLVTVKTLWFVREKIFTATTMNGAILKAMNRHRFSSIEGAKRIYKGQNNG